MIRRGTISRHNRRASGFNLVEVAGVLAIVGLLLGAIWVAYAHFTVANQVRKATQQLVAIVQNVRAQFPDQGISDTGADVNGVALTKSLDQLRIFPLDMRQDPSTPAGVVFNIWSNATANNLGTVSVYADNCAGTATPAGTQPCFGVSFLNVPQEACISLVAQTGQPSMGLQELKVNAVDVADAFGGTPLPVTSSMAQQACDNNGASGANDIIWVYQMKGGSQ